MLRSSCPRRTLLPLFFLGPFAPLVRGQIYHDAAQLSHLPGSPEASLSGIAVSREPSPPTEEESDYCPTNKWYITQEGESCDEIARAHTTSSGSLFLTNQDCIISCAEAVPSGARLCIPPRCGATYQVEDGDTCHSMERDVRLDLHARDVARYNPWVGFDCRDIQSVRNSHGSILCLGPLLGQHEAYSAGWHLSSLRFGKSWGYSHSLVDPPIGVELAEGTTPYCGAWYVPRAGDMCPAICIKYRVEAKVFLQVNPSLGTDATAACTSRLRTDRAYCVKPHSAWDTLDLPDEGEDEDDD